MIWDDLITPINSVVQSVEGFFYYADYLIQSFITLLAVIFQPLAFAFNFVKGFFVGIATPAPATAIAWTFGSQITGVFNAIPYWSLFTFATGAGISILFLMFIIKQLLKL
jgi:hypothetical protein